MAKHNASNSGTVFSYEFEEQSKALGIFPQKPILYVTIGTERHPIDYYMIDNLVIINPDVLINTFGLKDKALYRHQFGVNGDRYQSPDFAALAWGLTYWNESNNIGEYAAWIYKEAEGIYFVGDYGTTDPPSRTKGRAPARLDGYEVVASVHTHPNVFMHPPNNFSETDMYASYYNGYMPVYFVSYNQVRVTETRSETEIYYYDGERHETTRIYFHNERTVFSGLKFK